MFNTTGSNSLPDLAEIGARDRAPVLQGLERQGASASDSRFGVVLRHLPSSHEPPSDDEALACTHVRKVERGSGHEDSG